MVDKQMNEIIWVSQLIIKDYKLYSALETSQSLKLYSSQITAQNIKHWRKITLMECSMSQKYRSVFVIKLKISTNKILQLMLELDKIGPNWEIARHHGLASKPGRPIKNHQSFTGLTSLANIDNQSTHSENNFCECCLNVIHKEPMPLCENSKELQFLGFGFPLYFIFVKYTIILLLLQIVTYSALSLDWAVVTSFDICEEAHVRQLPNHHEGVCTSWLIKLMRTEEEVSKEEIILRITSFIIHLAGLVYMRDVIKKTNDYYDERTCSLSHYSVIIKNIPKMVGTQKLVRNFMQNGFSKNEGQLSIGIPFKVQELITLNELQEFYRIRDQKRAIIKQKQKFMKMSEEDPSKATQLLEIDRRLKEKEVQLKIELNKQKKQIKNYQTTCEKVIVVLETEKAKKALLQMFQEINDQKLVQYFGQQGGNIQITKAPQPKEIIWQNVNFPVNKRRLRLLMGWGLTLLFIAAVTGVFFGILYGKGHEVQLALKHIKQNPQDSEIHFEQQKALAATIITMLLIIFFNKFCLSFVLHLFTDIQKHQTGSQYEFSFGLKYTLGLFFTTAFITIIVQISVFHNVYSEKYGVAEQQSIMFFFNSFLVPLIWLINPWYICKLIKRWWLRERNNLTQQQANSLMQDPKYSIGKKYAQIIQSVWFTYLYYSIIPGGAILIFLGFVIYYWVDKFTLLRKSSINQNVNGNLSMQAMKLLDISLALRGVGEIIFDSQIRQHTSAQSIACIWIGVIYVLLPMNEILSFFHEQRFRDEQKPYSQVKTRFVENYHNLHPLFAQEKYALISGVNLTTQAMGFTEANIHESKDFINITKQELIRVRPKEQTLLEIKILE